MPREAPRVPREALGSATAGRRRVPREALVSETAVASEAASMWFVALKEKSRKWGSRYCTPALGPRLQAPRRIRGEICKV